MTSDGNISTTPEPPDRKLSARNGNDGTLHLYFRDMGNLDQLTAEQEADLWNKVDESLSRIRKAFSRCGFVYEEILGILADEDVDDYGDIFCPRAGAGVRDTVVATGEHRRWEKRLNDAWQALAAEYRKKKPDPGELNRLREAGSAVLEEYPVLPGKALEWLDVALHYDSMIQDGSMTRKAVLDRMLMDWKTFRLMLENCVKDRKEYESLKTRILEANLKLVINIAKHYQNKGLPLGDLIQEGNLGLMKALEKFDYRMGHRFCTYASWWIKEGIARALSAQTRVIRLPLHMVNSIRKMRIAEKNFIQQNGREPEDSDIAFILEMPEERVRAIRKMSLQCISLQAPRSNDEENSSIQDVLSDSESDDPMKAYAHKVMLRRLEKAISCLTERERMVISMRYGLNDNVCCSLSEVSQAFHITRERVRQIEIKTIEKLRKHSRSGATLDDYFLS